MVLVDATSDDLHAQHELRDVRVYISCAPVRNLVAELVPHQYAGAVQPHGARRVREVNLVFHIVTGDQMATCATHLAGALACPDFLRLRARQLTRCELGADRGLKLRCGVFHLWWASTTPQRTEARQQSGL